MAEFKAASAKRAEIEASDADVPLMTSNASMLQTSEGVYVQTGEERLSGCTKSISFSKTRNVASSCVDTRKEESCWKSWKFWEGAFWSCRWNTVTVIVSCVKKIVETAWKDVAASFDQCFNAIVNDVKKSALGNGLQQFAAFIPMNCGSVDSCKNDLLSKGNLLLKEVEKLAGRLLYEALDNPTMRPAVNFVKSTVPKIPPVLEKLGPLVVRIGKALLDFIVNSGNSIHALMQEIPTCTSDTNGIVILQPTDCGSFSALATLVNNFWNVPSIPGNMARVATRFGECLLKNELLSLPTPFFEAKVNSFCLPQFMAVPIKAIVGAFQYFTNQIKAGVTGCAGEAAEQPICELIAEMNSITNDIAKVFTSKLSLAQTAENMNQHYRSASVDRPEHTNQPNYRRRYNDPMIKWGKCSGQNFKIFIEPNVGLTINWPLSGPMSLSIGLEVFAGCRNNVPQIDAALGRGFDYSFLAGGALKPELNVDGGIGLGFDVTAGSWLCDSAIGCTSSQSSKDTGYNVMPGGHYAAGLVKIGGELDLSPKIPGEFKGELGVYILPPKVPTGFKIEATGSIKTVPLLQAQVDEAVKDAESPEEGFGSALGVALKHLGAMSTEKMFDAHFPSPQETMQKGAMAMSEISHTKDVGSDAFYAGGTLAGAIEIKFCLTCHLSEKQWEIPEAMGPLKSKHDDSKCLDFNTDCNDGDCKCECNVHMADCNDKPSQQWYFEGKEIKSWYDNQCLDYNFMSQNAYMHACHGGSRSATHGGTNQYWLWDGERLKTEYRKSKCMEYEAKTGNVHMKDCHDRDNQQWVLQASTSGPFAQPFTNSPDEPAFYNACKDTNYEMITDEAECREYAKFIGGTFNSKSSNGLWPSGCFRYSGVTGKSVYLNTGKGTGHSSHVVACRLKSR
jgi:hypothetical protein